MKTCALVLATVVSVNAFGQTLRVETSGANATGPPAATDAFGTASQSVLTVSPWEFVIFAAAAAIGYDGLRRYNQSGQTIAAVHLPTGALVTGMELEACDSNASAQVAVADNPRPWALNVFLTLSLLPSLQRPWLVLATGTAFGVGGLLLFVERGLLAAMTEPPGLVFLAFVGAQTLLLTHVARRNGQRGEERFDIEFLVRAMGSDGPIRLDLDAVRAESALGERLKHVQQRMADAIRQAHVAARDVREASQELDGSGEALRERTERSAAGLRDAALTLEQITATVQTSARAALEARSMAASASQQAVQGGELFDQVTQRMQDIDKASRRITDVIGVIDGIAFQTNILALNAAVEAARAGEQGRGFAVVASEVRSLAQRSAEAAREIKALIGTSVDKVEAGSRLVKDAGTTMDEIVASVQRVSDIIGEITAAAVEQSSGIGQVSSAVNQLDQMTQQNAALVEESAASAESLRQQATHLTQVVSTFSLDPHSARA